MEKILLTEITSSPEETEALGARLADMICKDGLPLFVALYGDLGVGKTALIRGVASRMSPGSAVRSPTFALVNEYRKGKTPLFHFDVYRINGEDDLYSTGFYDYLEEGLCLVEWCERIPFAVPERHIYVKIEKTDLSRPDERRITVGLVG